MRTGLLKGGKGPALTGQASRPGMDGISAYQHPSPMRGNSYFLAR